MTKKSFLAENNDAKYISSGLFDILKYFEDFKLYERGIKTQHFIKSNPNVQDRMCFKF